MPRQVEALARERPAPVPTTTKSGPAIAPAVTSARVERSSACAGRRPSAFGTWSCADAAASVFGVHVGRPSGRRPGRDRSGRSPGRRCAASVLDIVREGILEAVSRTAGSRRRYREGTPAGRAVTGGERDAIHVHGEDGRDPARDAARRCTRRWPPTTRRAGRPASSSCSEGLLPSFGRRDRLAVDGKVKARRRPVHRGEGTRRRLRGDRRATRRRRPSSSGAGSCSSTSTTGPTGTAASRSARSPSSEVRAALHRAGRALRTRGARGLMLAWARTRLARVATTRAAPAVTRAGEDPTRAAIEAVWRLESTRLIAGARAHRARRRRSPRTSRRTRSSRRSPSGRRRASPTTRERGS